MSKLKGIAPDMENKHDKVDNDFLEAAFAEYREGMDYEDLEREIQVLWGVGFEDIDDIEVAFYIVENSLEITPGQDIKEYVDQGYTRMGTVISDDYLVFLTKINNLEDFMHI